MVTSERRTEAYEMALRRLLYRQAAEIYLKELGYCVGTDFKTQMPIFWIPLDTRECMKRNGYGPEEIEKHIRFEGSSGFHFFPSTANLATLTKDQFV